MHLKFDRSEIIKCFLTGLNFVIIRGKSVKVLNAHSKKSPSKVNGVDGHHVEIIDKERRRSSSSSSSRSSHRQVMGRKLEW